jgi:hypothetical protein
LTPTRIVLSRAVQCPVEEGKPGNGEYTLEFTGNELAFALVADRCRTRAQVLSGGPWHRK